MNNQNQKKNETRNNQQIVLNQVERSIYRDGENKHDNTMFAFVGNDVMEFISTFVAR